MNGIGMSGQDGRGHPPPSLHHGGWEQDSDHPRATLVHHSHTNTDILTGILLVFVCLSVIFILTGFLYLSVCFYLSIFILSIYVYNYQSIYLFTFLSIHLTLFLSILLGPIVELASKWVFLSV